MPLSTALRKLLCCAAPREEETEARPRPARPEPVHAGPEPARAGSAQAGRPYRDFVEGEAARFRREIENAGSLNEAGQQEGGMLALLSKPGRQEAGAGALLTEPGRQEAGAIALLSKPGQPEAGAVALLTEPGQQETGAGASLNEPGQREAGKVALLNEPGQQEAGAAALPDLPRARRGSPGPQSGPVLPREQMVVHVVQMYLVKKGFIKPPYSRLESRPNHVEALLQLQADANWQAREFPLPAHPDPQHPAIFYYINDPVSNRPVPTEDSLIRGDYVYDPADGSRITQDEHIRPWRGADYQPSFHDICAGGWCAYYTFSFLGTGQEDRSQDRSQEISSDEAAITYHWIKSTGGIPVLMRKRDRIMSLTPFGNRVLKGLHFSPGPPSPADIYRLRRTRDQLIFEMLGST